MDTSLLLQTHLGFKHVFVSVFVLKLGKPLVGPLSLAASPYSLGKFCNHLP